MQQCYKLHEYGESVGLHHSTVIVLIEMDNKTDGNLTEICRFVLF